MAAAAKGQNLEVAIVLGGPTIDKIAALVGVDPSPPIVIGEGLTLATGDRFIADPAERQRLASVAHLVDMEGYAVASAAQLLDLELIVIKHVSDQADDAAPDRWIDAVAMSSKELAVWLDANHR